MEIEKRKRLEAKGWKIGNASEFLKEKSDLEKLYDEIRYRDEFQQLSDLSISFLTGLNVALVAEVRKPLPEYLNSVYDFFYKPL